MNVELRVWCVRTDRFYVATLVYLDDSHLPILWMSNPSDSHETVEKQAEDHAHNNNWNVTSRFYY